MNTSTISDSASATGRGDSRPRDGSMPAAELALATRLFHALACGHGRLSFNIAGSFPLWRMRKRRAKGEAAEENAPPAPGSGSGSPWRLWEPVPGCERVPTGEWRPCLEVTEEGTTKPRRFNPYVLAGHIRGNYDVAPMAPSWTGLAWIDIDAQIEHELRHDDSDEILPDAAFTRALADRDARLAAVWRALRFGPGREPLLLRSPGIGYHVGLPLTRGAASPHEHTWPALEVIERVSTALHRHGLELRDGRIELYPAARPLRAPCGRGSLLLHATRPDQPDDLGLEPVPGTVQTQRRRGYDGDLFEVRVRRRWPMVAAFLEQCEAVRRPLEDWLCDGRPWTAVRGPFEHPDRALGSAANFQKNGDVANGADCRSQHIDEVPGGPGGRAREPRVGQGGERSPQPHDDPSRRSESDRRSDPSSPASSPASRHVGASRVSLVSPLRKGREFRAYLAQLLRGGVVSPGTRHDAVLSLVFWWHVAGKTEAQVRAELEGWLRAHPHVSRLKGERLVRSSLREGMHYYHRIKKLPQRARSLAATQARVRPLAAADFLVLAQVREDVREEAWAILEFLHGHAEQDGRVTRPLPLGRAQLDSVVVADRRVMIDGKGRHRAEVVAVRELERVGVLSLWVDYSTGNHGRIFSCWYQFGSGVLPVAREPGSYERSRAHHKAPADALVVAERHVREGTLRVLCDGTRRAPRIEIEPGEQVVNEEGGGASWWRKLYEGRVFTVGEFFEADPAVMVAGPWTRPPPVRYGALVEELPAMLPRARGSYDPAPSILRAPAASPPVDTGAAPIVTAEVAAAPIAATDPRAELAVEMGDAAFELPEDVAEFAAIGWRAFARRPPS